MPTYTYKCRECGHAIDVLQKISDAPLKECPKCSGSVNRVFHPVGIIFKGSGFYTTDYKRKSTSPPAVDTKNEKPEKKEKPAAPAAKPAEKAAT